VESSKGRSECPDIGPCFYSRSAQAASSLLHADWLNGGAIAQRRCAAAVKLQYWGFIDVAAILVQMQFRYI